LDEQALLTHDNGAQASVHGHPFYLKCWMVFLKKKTNNAPSINRLFEHLRWVEPWKVRSQPLDLQNYFSNLFLPKHPPPTTIKSVLYYGSYCGCNLKKNYFIKKYF
jgi:hypothetical protein